ncbi:alcohol dehydrogenase, partial [Escherichia coli]|nr:alcohol dehydrogenase [Escherichia coli]
NLADLGVPPDDITSLSAAALNVKRLMNNSPCQLNQRDVQAIYQTLFPQHQFKE